MKTRKQIEKEIAELQKELKQIEKMEYEIPDQGFYLVEVDDGELSILVLSNNLKSAPPVYGFNVKPDFQGGDTGYDTEQTVERLFEEKELKVIKRLDISDIIRYVQEKTEDN